MNILFLSLYSIDTIEDGYIYADLIKQFVDENHNVYVITPGSQKSKEKVIIVECDTCKIIKVRIGAIQKVNKIKKVFNLFLLESKTISALKKNTSNVKFDLIITMTSSLSLFKTTFFVKKRDNAKVYMLLKDIFPQNAVDIELIKKNGILHEYFQKKENKYYDLCDYIGCISPANVDTLLKNHKFKDNIVEENPNSVYLMDKKEILNSQKDLILKKYNIESNKTMFFYGGNLGKPQGIDFICKCIDGFDKFKNAFFFIVGDGTEYIKIQNYIEEHKIENTKLFKRVSQTEYDVLVNLSDVGLVFLDSRFTIPNYPSRVLSYMESKLPIIFATDDACDAKIIAKENKFGLSCSSKDTKDFFEAVELLINEPALAKEMGENGYRYLIENYTTKKSYDIIMNHFKEDKADV